MKNFFKKVFKYILIPVLAILTLLKLSNRNTTKKQAAIQDKTDTIKKEISELQTKKTEQVEEVNKVVDSVHQLNEDYKNESTKEPSKNLSDIVDRINSR